MCFFSTNSSLLVEGRVAPTVAASGERDSEAEAAPPQPAQVERLSSGTARQRCASWPDAKARPPDRPDVFSCDRLGTGGPLLKPCSPSVQRSWNMQTSSTPCQP